MIKLNYDKSIKRRNRMKLLLEFISGIFAGAVAALIIFIMDIDITVLQTAVLIGGTVFTTIITQEISTTILKKQENKKKENS